MSILNISSGRWEQPESGIWAIRCCYCLRMLEIAARTGRVWCAQFLLSLMCWSLERWPSEIIFALLDSLLFPLELIPLVQHLCCRIPLVGPSIWTLSILSPSCFGTAPSRWRWFLPTGHGSTSENKQNFKAAMPHPASSGLSWLLFFCSAKCVTNMTSLEKSDFSVIVNSTFKSSF